jgi:hypothetical protein
VPFHSLNEYPLVPAKSFTKKESVFLGVPGVFGG